MLTIVTTPGITGNAAGVRIPVWVDRSGQPARPGRMMRFVCSIGKVALAVVLWNGGISFGGVVAFIFARPDHPADPDQLDPQGGSRMQSLRLSVC